MGKHNGHCFSVTHPRRGWNSVESESREEGICLRAELNGGYTRFNDVHFDVSDDYGAPSSSLREYMLWSVEGVNGTSTWEQIDVEGASFVPLQDGSSLLAALAGSGVPVGFHFSFRIQDFFRPKKQALLPRIVMNMEMTGGRTSMPFKMKDQTIKSAPMEATYLGLAKSDLNFNTGTASGSVRIYEMSEDVKVRKKLERVLLDVMADGNGEWLNLNPLHLLQLEPFGFQLNGKVAINVDDVQVMNENYGMSCSLFDAFRGLVTCSTPQFLTQ